MTPPRKIEELTLRMERFRNACRDAGLKITHQRLEIFRELAKTGEHPDAETLYKAVSRRMPTVSLDTVYRTLWLLIDLGVIVPLGHSQERMRFDANMASHHHFVCRRCGLTRDIAEQEDLRARVPKEANELGRVERAVIEFRGLCARCVQQDNPGRSRKPR
jgi:Fur family transcriptional regulator, peroxide stress response regulator